MPNVWQQLKKKAHQELNQCRFWSRVATYLIDPSKQSQHDSARVGTSNAKAGPNMDARKGFIPAIIGLTSRWRLAVRAKGPFAEDDMGERWNWNESAQQLTTQDSGIQNATKAQTIVDFSTAHSTRNTLAARRWFPSILYYYFSYFHILSSKKKAKKKGKKEKNGKMSPLCNFYPIHRSAINVCSQKSCCSDL